MVPRFFNRGNRLRPVNRIKHVFDEQGGIVAGVQNDIVIIEAKDAPVIANTFEVQTGATINGVFFIVEVNATSSAALPNVYMIIFKNPSNHIAGIAANNVGVDPEKKFVIHQEMVMLQGQTNSNPRTLFKGVVAIPRGYRRFGPDDKLNMQLLAPGVNINYCVQAHYKEFR